MWNVMGTASVCLASAFDRRIALLALMPDPFAHLAPVHSFAPIGARRGQLLSRKLRAASRSESSSSSCLHRLSRTARRCEFQNKFPRDRARPWPWHREERFHTLLFAANHASAVPRSSRCFECGRRATCRRAYTGTHLTQSEGYKHSRDPLDASAWQSRNRSEHHSKCSARNRRNRPSGTTPHDSAGRAARAARREAPSCGRIARTPDTFPAETRRECPGYAPPTCLPGLRSGTLRRPKSQRTSARSSPGPEESYAARARHFPASSAVGADG